MSADASESISFLIPAKNESASIGDVVRALRRQFADAEVLVVNDGSTDETAEIAGAAGALLINHPYSMGNGAAIKSGLRAASGDIVVFLDADGQHAPEDAQRLIDPIRAGYDLAIGARNFASQASAARGIGNWIYRKLASYIVGHRIDDLTSGFRAMRRSAALEFVSLLPNGFSAPTTTTMAFFRAGYSVRFVPITMPSREGRSHIRLFRDAGRFLLIIFRLATLYSPLKVFFPAAMFQLAAGVSYYLYTFMTLGRFTNFGVILLVSSVLTFLIGLVSEQITTLVYMKSGESNRHQGRPEPRAIESDAAAQHRP